MAAAGAPAAAPGAGPPLQHSVGSLEELVGPAYLAGKGLKVLEVYSWAGPCKSVLPVLRRVRVAVLEGSGGPAVDTLATPIVPSQCGCGSECWPARVPTHTSASIQPRIKLYHTTPIPQMRLEKDNEAALLFASVNADTLSQQHQQQPPSPTPGGPGARAAAADAAARIQPLLEHAGHCEPLFLFFRNGQLKASPPRLHLLTWLCPSKVLGTLRHQYRPCLPCMPCARR
jgi:hypothetical protein